jgi:KaiC/GvpD/RAD55 family RecA-like ATPase
LRLGIDWLTDVLISRPGSLIFTGVNGVGKTLLAIQSVYRALQQGRKCVYALTTMAPRTFLEMASSISVDLYGAVEAGRLVIVDIHTRGEPGQLARYSVSPESSLLQIREALLVAAEGERGYLQVIDDISTLLAYTPSEPAFKFYQGIAADLRRNEATGIAIIVPEILEPKLTNLLNSLSDGVVEMLLEEMGGNLRRFVRIRFLRGVRHPTEMLEFQIGARGIELLTD